MPVLRPGPHLAAAFASIGRQTPAPVEIIVVHGPEASPEKVPEAPAGLCWMAQELRGAAAARNAGIAVARGELIAFLDADDEWADDTFAILLETLRGNPAALFALGRTRLDPPTVAPWVSPNLGAGLYRREAFTRIGLLCETVRDAEDVDWFLRAREQNVPYAVTDHVVLCYRRWTGSVTAGRSWRDVRLEPVLRASLARRRQAKGAARELSLLSGSVIDPRAAGPVNHVHADNPTH